jgi:hypothetical protein
MNIGENKIEESILLDTKSKILYLYFSDRDNLGSRLHFYVFHNNELYSAKSKKKYNWFATPDDYDLNDYNPGENETKWLLAEYNIDGITDCDFYLYDERWVEKERDHFSEYEVELFKRYNRESKINKLSL